ncbi:GABA permease [Brevibacterium sanguinis]|uniref:GABA permease n=2 Tax=Brevibacterium TaxID=1696 RepID=A0A366IJW3_9MICO|nr:MULTISPECIES: amino acid permease [Brevibacterium]RBP66066.1 GABA permease [Brevibacterium sanguinis]RBP72717.1 GABA permease [Brevibacterium celere]
MHTSSSDADGGAPVVTKAKLRNRHITMITLGGIIGASLFVGSGNVIRSTGPAAILSYLIGGVLVFLAMRMLGEMSARKPSVGSFMEYANESMGGWAAYLVGWLYWYFWVGVIAYEAVVGGGLLVAWFPVLPEWLWALILVLVFIGTNILSVRVFGEVEFWLASIKVITIVVFLVVGALFAFGLWPDADFAVPNLWSHGGFAPMGYSAVMIGVATVIFSYFGTEIAVMAAAESVDPARGINQATVTVIWRIMLFFVGAVLIIVMATPWNQLPDPLDVAPFAYVYGLFGLPGAEQIMTIVLFTAVISVLNSGLYSASRMFVSLADKGYAPHFITKRSKNNVPVAALIASSLGALAAVVANFAVPSSGIFDFIMNSGGLVALFVYVFIALAQWRMRVKLTPEERAALPIRSWMTPILNFFLIAVVLGVVIIMCLGETGRAQVSTSLIATVALVVFWPLVKKKLNARGIDTSPTMDQRQSQDVAAP